MGLFKSAYATIYKAFRSLLNRDGLNVGGTSGYPRVELHSFTEGAPMDKDGSLRQLELTVESMSERSVAEAVEMADANLERLLEENDITSGDFNIIGVVPTQLRDITEVSETTQVLYRILQTFTVFVSQTAPAVVSEDAEENEINS